MLKSYIVLITLIATLGGLLMLGGFLGGWISTRLGRKNEGRPTTVDFTKASTVETPLHLRVTYEPDEFY